jgi:hypothetical protein
MKKLMIGMVAVAMLSSAPTTWAAFDRPPGEPPFGVILAPAGGIKLVCALAGEFTDWRIDLSAEALRAVLRCRKGNSIKVFFAHVVDPDGRLSATDPARIQALVIEAFEEQILRFFFADECVDPNDNGGPLICDLQVDLKDLEEFEGATEELPDGSRSAWFLTNADFVVK